MSRLTKLTSLNIRGCSHATEGCLDCLKGLPLVYLFCNFRPKLVAGIDSALCLAVLRTWRSQRADQELWQL